MGWLAQSLDGRGQVTKLTIVANILANLDQIDLVKAELEKLVHITRGEMGCIQ